MTQRIGAAIAHIRVRSQIKICVEKDWDLPAARRAFTAKSPILRMRRWNMGITWERSAPKVSGFPQSLSKTPQRPQRGGCAPASGVAQCLNLFASFIDGLSELLNFLIRVAYGPGQFFNLVVLSIYSLAQFFKLVVEFIYGAVQCLRLIFLFKYDLIQTFNLTALFVCGPVQFSNLVEPRVNCLVQLFNFPVSFQNGAVCFFKLGFVFNKGLS